MATPATTILFAGIDGPVDVPRVQLLPEADLMTAAAALKVDHTAPSKGHSKTSLDALRNRVSVALQNMLDASVTPAAADPANATNTVTLLTQLAEVATLLHQQQQALLTASPQPQAPAPPAAMRLPSTAEFPKMTDTISVADWVESIMLLLPIFPGLQVPATLGAFVRAALTGTASDWFHALPDTQRAALSVDGHALLAAVQTEFANRERLRALMAFKQVKLSLGDDVTAFVAHFRRLVRQAGLSPTLAFDRLVTAVPSALAMHVHLACPNGDNVDTALTTVQTHVTALMRSGQWSPSTIAASSTSARSRAAPGRPRTACAFCLAAGLGENFHWQTDCEQRNKAISLLNATTKATTKSTTVKPTTTKDKDFQ